MDKRISLRKNAIYFNMVHLNPDLTNMPAGMKLKERQSHCILRQKNSGSHYVCPTMTSGKRTFSLRKKQVEDLSVKCYIIVTKIVT